MTITKKAGVIGSPVKHSISPFIHEYWLKQHQLQGAYYKLFCPDTDENFNDLIKKLISLGYSGVNVTLPHKKRAYAIANSFSETAIALGVANTLTFSQNGIHADNTDAYGFEESIKEVISDTDQKSLALVLGAGGAAPAVCFALHNAGFQKIIVANRSNDKAQNLVQDFSFITTSCLWSDIDTLVPDADIIVNCTSLGMPGSADLDVSLTDAKDSAIVADIIYIPLETGLVKAARERGLRTTNGLPMLMHQATTGLYSWYGKKPEVSARLEAHLIDVLENWGNLPIKIGLTGSIGMGKSTAAKVLAKMGAAVWDADTAVHRLYQAGGAAVPVLKEHFPDVIVDDAVSRDLLSKHLMENADDFKLLERLVHPLVAIDREKFIKEATKQNVQAVILDVPLLFETGQSHHFDEVIVVTADLDIRKERVLARPGMTEKKLASIVSRQMSEEEKILLADHVIRTDGTHEETASEIESVFHKILDNYEKS